MALALTSAAAAPVSAGTTISLTLPTITENSAGYLVFGTNGGTLPTMSTPPSGWTALFSPAGHTTGGDAWLYAKDLTVGDSGATVSLVVSATQRLHMAAAVVNGTQDASAQQVASVSLTATVPVPAVTPVAGDCMDVVLGWVNDGTAAGAIAVTPPSGFTEALDNTSSYGSGNDVDVFIDWKQLSGQAGVSQGSTTAAVSPSSRGYVFRVTVAPVVAASPMAFTKTITIG